MKKLSPTSLLFSGISAAIAGCCWSLVYLAATSHSGGGWLFAAFGFLFSVLPIFALVRVLATRVEAFARLARLLSPESREEQAVSFGPHRMLLLGMIVIALSILFLVGRLLSGLF